MSARKTLDILSARAGNDRDVRVGGTVEPRIDAVVVAASPNWLKGDAVVFADLTPKAARRLAVQLIEAAERIDERHTDELL